MKSTTPRPVELRILSKGATRPNAACISYRNKDVVIVEVDFHSKRQEVTPVTTYDPDDHQSVSFMAFAGEGALHLDPRKPHDEPTCFDFPSLAKYPCFVASAHGRYSCTIVLRAKEKR